MAEPGDVQDPGQPGSLDMAQFACPGEDFLDHQRGQRAVVVDERQRHLAIERDVERMPELQIGWTTVEDEQPVAAVGDDRAGPQRGIVAAA